MTKAIVYRKREGIVNIKGESLPEYIRPEEVERIIHAVEVELNAKTTPERQKQTKRHLLAIQTLWMTGIRVSELVQLRSMDIMEGGLRVFGKRKPRTKEEIERGIVHEKRQRIVPIPVVLRQKLINYVFDEKLGSEQRLFPFTTTRVYQFIDFYAKKAGIQRKIYPHMFRHGFAVHFLETTHSLNALQQVLGHSNLQSTTIYTKLTNEEIQRYMDMTFSNKKVYYEGYGR